MAEVLLLQRAVDRRRRGTQASGPARAERAELQPWDKPNPATQPECSPSQEPGYLRELLVHLLSHLRAEGVEGLDGGAVLEGEGPRGGGQAVDEHDRVAVAGETRPDRCVDGGLVVGVNEPLPPVRRVA